MERLRACLVVSLAAAFSAAGGAKLATWSTALGKVDDWTSTIAWKAALSTAGVLEIAIGVSLTLVRDPQRLLRWTLRLLSSYACVLVVGELAIGGFSGKCGCLGPGVALGLAGHLVLTGLLIGSTWWCEHLFRFSGGSAPASRA